MGLLDDAIREHLELQRRRGADPSEIERAERDALGPVRRAPEELDSEATLAPGADGPADDEYGYEYEDQPAADYAPMGEDHLPEAEASSHPAAEVPPYEREAPPFEAAAPEYEPPTEYDEPDHPTPPPAPETAVADTALPRAAPDPDAAPADEPHAPETEPETEPHRPDVLDRETVEYDVEAEPQGEDMLEETPEFLQDAPEHDRLWFEQRPPRDFDFDG